MTDEAGQPSIWNATPVSIDTDGGSYSMGTLHQATPRAARPGRVGPYRRAKKAVSRRGGLEMTRYFYYDDDVIEERDGSENLYQQYHPGQTLNEKPPQKIIVSNRKMPQLR